MWRGAAAWPSMGFQVGILAMVTFTAVAIQPASAQWNRAAGTPADYVHELPTWTKEGIIVGATSSRPNCALSTHVWVVDGEDGFCIRFFTNHVKSRGGATIFFFGGDLLGSDWDRTGHSKGVLFADPGETGPLLFKKINDFVERAAHLPLVYVSRPGILGSSGDHKKKYEPQESRVVNAAIDSLKTRLGVKDLVLAGQSGGATLVANILPKRSDVKCAVMGSGAGALWQFASRFIAPDVYQKWEDPIQSVQQIRNTSSRLYVIAGEGDKIRPPEYQKLYAQALADRGLDVRFALIRKSGDPHNVIPETLRAADACGQGKDIDQHEAIALGDKLPLPRR
jgi:dienelactone hydrolase